MRRTAALQLCGLLAVGPALGFTPSSFPLEVIRSSETGPVSWHGPRQALAYTSKALGPFVGPPRPGVGYRQFPVPTFASATQDLEAPATEGSQQELSRFIVVRPRSLGKMLARRFCCRSWTRANADLLRSACVFVHACTGVPLAVFGMLLILSLQPSMPLPLAHVDAGSRAPSGQHAFVCDFN